MKLYQNMKKLDDLANRLGNGEQTQADLDYLAKCLSSICDGDDAHVVFDIKPTSKGMRRSDYRPHRKIADAFKRITAFTDPLEVIDDGGILKVVEVKSKRDRLQKIVIPRVAGECGFDADTLGQYWKEKKYAHLKTAEA